MLTSPNAIRVGEIPKDKRPEHFANLKDHTIITSGTLDGHGAVALASEKAKLSARVVKLVRTSSGGIDYELAIHVDEPEPVVVTESVAVDPNLDEAVAFLQEHGGLSEDEAKASVNKFGTARVLTAKKDYLDSQLDFVLRQANRPPVAAAEQESKRLPYKAPETKG